MPNNGIKELQEIAKELKELNRRLDRLCRASILSIDTPEVIIRGSVDVENFEKEKADAILKEFTKGLFPDKDINLAK